MKNVEHRGRVTVPLDEQDRERRVAARTTATPMVAYGASCTWWDDKAKVATKPSGLPCCPHCGGVLFETDMESWWEDAHRYQDAGNEGYVPFLRWLQGKCFSHFDVARAAYTTEQGAG